MLNSNQKKQAQFKAGLFIIASLSLLIFTILWLRYFAITPDFHIIARFENPGPLSKGVIAYYKGIDIGKVGEVCHAPDFKKTDVHIKIFKKGMKIPCRSRAEIKMEGITGQKYIDIIPIQDNTSNILSEGDVIYGKSPFNLSDIQQFLSDNFKATDIKEMKERALSTLKVTEETMVHLNELMSTNKQDLHLLIQSSANTFRFFQKTSENIEEITSEKEFKTGVVDTFSGIGKLSNKTGDLIEKCSECPNFKEELTLTAKSLNSLFHSADKLVNDLDKNTNDLYRDIKRTRLIENVSCAFAKAGITLDEASDILDELEKNGLEKDVKTLIISTLRNSNTAAKSVNCMSNGISELFSKRFLLLRLLFGKPGGYFEKCKKQNNKCSFK